MDWPGRGLADCNFLRTGQTGLRHCIRRNAYLKQANAAPTAILDPAGTLGHLYDAKTTPHIFVINPRVLILWRD